MKKILTLNSFSFGLMRQRTKNKTNQITTTTKTILAGLLICSSSFLNAQTTLINPAAEGGFDLGPDFTSNGWTVDNGTATNKWFVGTVPTGFTGNSAYISADAGVTNGFTNNSASIVHFYRDVTIPAGETSVTLSFNWKGLGEAGFYDALMVSVAPTTYVPTASTTSIALANLAAPASTIASFWNSSTVGTANITIPQNLINNCGANSTIRLIFTWKNDGSGGSDPSAAIDNINMVSNFPPPALAPGTYTIDNTLPTGGANFISFTDAFLALNNASICPILGNYIFNVTAGQTFNELPPVLTGGGNISATVIFQKSGLGLNPVITSTGTTGTNDASVCISGGDFITFDGIDINNSASAAMEYGYLIRNASATNGAQNNVLKNMTVTLNRTNATSSSAGILISATTTGGGLAVTALTGSNNLNQVLNFNVTSAINGVSILGTSAFPDLSNIIGVDNPLLRNTISSVGPTLSTFVSAKGINLTNQNGLIVGATDITGVASNQAAAHGISATGISGTSQIAGNKIYNIAVTGSTTTSSSAYGMQVSQSTTGTNTVTIANNMIADVSTTFTGTATANRRVYGLQIGTASATTSQVYNVWHNSISVGSGLTPTYSNTCFELQNVSAVYKVQNNIFANFTNAQTGVARHYTWVTTSPTNIGGAGTISNRNDLYVANDVNTSGFIGLASTTAYPTINAWTTAITAIPGTDLNSANTNPTFVNNLNDLHLNLGAAQTQIESGGNGTLGITLDIDGQNRPGPTGSVNGGGTNPDMGADEFDGFPAAPPVITFNSSTPATTTLCATTARLISVDITDAAATVTGAVLNYSFNGVAQTPIVMTNTAGSTWQGTLPVATPSNATVIWNVTATNSIPLSSIYNGTTYYDEPLFGLVASATSSLNNVCASTPVDLTAIFATGTLATYTAPPAVTNPTTDEDLGNITIMDGPTTVLNNTTTGGSLVGTIGTATGTGGSYSNFTAFGPYTLSQGKTYSFSLTSITQGGNFGNTMAIYIDYNRNGVFTDAGERVTAALATTTGPHTETGSFTVPVTAGQGLTRMRVLVNEGAVTSPTQSISWGEYEEYTINLNPEITSVVWSDGVGTVGTTNPLTVTPSATTTYTASITAMGCVLTPAPTVTVTVVPVNVTLTPIDASCNGFADGSFALGAVNCGTAPFMYSVNGSLFGAIPTNLIAGTYSVIVQDANLDVSAVNTVVVGQPSYVVTPPTAANVSACLNDISALVSATSSTPAATPLTASFGTNLTSNGTTPSTYTVTVPALPANATITGTTLLITNAAAINGSWRSEIRVELTGATVLAPTQISTLNSSGPITPNPSITIPNLPISGGSVTVSLTETFDDASDDATFGNIQIIVSYTLANDITWWDMPTAGANLGTGSPFETVGTTILPNTATPGVYTFYAQGNSGVCPSLTRTPVTVTVNSPSASTTTITDCDTYTWTNGTVYNATGTYTQTLVNAVGCDSIATLNLTILNSSTSTTTQVQCDGTFTWTNGMTYTTTGLYTQTLVNAVGCDSIATLDLTINLSTASTTTQTQCEGTFTWTDNVTYSTSGTYTQLLTNAVGCDSVATLVLTINSTSASTTTISQCGGSYTWTDGNSYNTTGIYTQTLVNAVGCDSIATLDLTVLHATASTTTITQCGGSYTWTDGNTYTASTIVTQQLTNSIGCDSLATLVLTINTIPTATATDNGDATITASAGTTYEWIDCATGTTVFGETSQTFAPSVNGSYQVVVTNASGCSDTSACVSINYIGIKENSAQVIGLYPNPTHDEVTVTFSAPNATVRILDAQGKELANTSIENNGKINLGSYESGVYFFQVSTENGTTLHRVVKN